MASIEKVPPQIATWAKCTRRRGRIDHVGSVASDFDNIGFPGYGTQGIWTKWRASGTVVALPTGVHDEGYSWFSQLYFPSCNLLAAASGGASAAPSRHRRPHTGSVSEPGPEFRRGSSGKDGRRER